MNVDLHRLVFNKARGMCVAVAETATSSGKAGAAARGERHALAAAVPAVFVATLSLLASAALQAQTRPTLPTLPTLPTGGAIKQGAGSVSVEGAKMIVNQTTPRMVADWSSFSIGAGNTVQFVQPSSSSVALNRVLGSDASQIFGSLLSNGHVYLQNPNGVLFAPGAQVSVGSLVATSLNADLRAFMDGSLRLSGGSTASGLVRNEGSISTSTGGMVLLAGPQVSNSGVISTPGGTLALAAGNAVNVDPTGSGLMSISVPVAAVNAQLENTGTLTADGGLVALQASLHTAATDAARRSVMNVGGVVRARSIEARNGQIVLSGGTSGTVSVSGTLDASGGEGLSGGTVKVLGERVALVEQARLDASGGTGGGTVLVGGNYQGRGPEANAAYTSVGKDVVIDASARDRGNGGLAVVWSDKATSYAGQANARGGEQRGDGGLIEVSGKEQLSFAGGADLRASRGKSGRLLLDPSSITIGTVANVNGDPTPGDDVTGNIASTDFPGAASQITATQVATLLGTADLSLAATNNITVASPVTVPVGGSATTLTLTAPLVNVNGGAALTLRNASLAINATNTGSGDAIQLNAPINSGASVALTGNAIRLSNSITAPSVTITGNAAAASNSLVQQFVTGVSGIGIDADVLTINRFNSVTLTGSNRTNLIRSLDVTATSASISVGNPPDAPPLALRGTLSSLGLFSQSGITQSNAAGQSLRVGDGAFLLITADTGATTGQVNLTNPDNAFSGAVAFRVASGLNLVANGGLRVTGFLAGGGFPAGSTAGGNIRLTANGAPFRLAADLTTSATSAAPNIDISGAGFVNELSDGVGHQLIVPAGGRFVVRSSNYSADSLGTLGFSATGLRDFNFRAYNAFGGPEPTSGNGFFTNRIGVLTPGLPTAFKVYDGTATFDFFLSGTGATVSELVGADTAFRGLTGGYSVNGTGNFADKNVGIDKAYATNPSTNVTAVASTAGIDNGATYYGLIARSVSRPAGPSTPALPLPLSQVTARAVTISGVTANNKVYDATAAATLSGTPTADTVPADFVGIGGTAVSAFDNKNVGIAKPVTVTGYTLTGIDATNYTLTQPTGLTANVTPLGLAVTGLAASNKVYDATTAATLTGIAAAVPLPGDVVTVIGSGAGSFDNKDVGNAKPVTVTGFNIGGLDGANYTALQPAGLRADITPASLQVRGVGALNKVYDSTTAATLTGSATIAPFEGDLVTLNGSGVGTFNDKNVGNAKPVAVTGYTVGGSDAGNYTLLQPTGVTADITAANLVLTGITAANKTYDATTAATLLGTPGFMALGSDVVTVTGTGIGSFDNKNVGNAKPVTITGHTIGGLDGGNYAVQQPTGLTANITAAALQVTGVGAANKVYDTTTTATLTGTATIAPLGSDAITLGGSGSGSFDNKNVGNAKPVTVTGYTIGGLDAGNYALQQPTGVAADITAANLVLTGVTAANKTYDATTAATLLGTPTFTALGSDAVTVTGVGVGTFNNKDVGANKPVTVTGFTLGGLEGGNYAVQQPTGLTADITAAALQVTGVGAANKVYDTTTTATLTGTATIAPLGSDVVTLAGGIGTFNNKNVGTAKPVTITGYSIGGGDAGNYTLLQPTGVAADITPTSLTLAGISAVNKVYDATVAATLVGTGTVTSLPGDSVTLGSGTGSFNNKNVGTAKPITVTGYTLGGADGGNYTLVLPSTLAADITPATLAITGLGAADKVYDANTVATLTGSPTVTALAGDAVSVGGSGAGRFADKHAGIAKPVTVSGFTLDGADAGNYRVLQPAGLAANIRPLDFTVFGVTANDKVYDSTTAATWVGTPTISRIAGDDVTVVAGTASFVDKNVGAGKTVIASGFTLTGADAGNYRAFQPTGLSANVTPAPIRVGGVGAAPKLYDATTGVTLTGTPVVTPLGSDKLAVLGTGAGLLPDKNAGTARPVQVSGFTLGGPDAANYSLLQPVGVTADVTPRMLTLAGIIALDRPADGTTTVALVTTGASMHGVLPGDTVALMTGGAVGSVASPTPGNKPVLVRGLGLSGPDAVNYALVATADASGASGLAIGTVTLFSAGQDAFNRVRDREYLQGVSDAQEPFRRALVEALAAGFGKENIRKQLQRGLVFETGLASPAVDTIEPAQRPASCTLGGSGAGLRMACN